MQQPPETDAPNPPAPAVAPRATLRRRLLLALASTLTLLLLGLGWLSASQTGFALLWRAVAQLSGQALSVEQVEGTLWQGFSLKGIHFIDPARELNIEHLRLDWQPAALWQRQLHIKLLDIGLVRFTSRTPAPASPWPGLPRQLSLPLDVRVDQLRLAGVSLDGGRWNAYGLQASYTYAAQQHRLKLQQLQLPQAEVQGQLSLAAQAPFALSGTLHLASDAGRADLNASGNLQQLRLSGQVRAHPVSLDLDAILLPFAAQPFQRIAQLNLHTTALNPQSVQPAWPRAALDIAAHIEPDQGTRLRATLSVRNHQAGPWSDQRLPLAALDAALASDGTTLTINTLRASVANGQVQLVGSVASAGLALDANLTGLALQALLASAPRDVISGRIQLRGSMAAPTLQTQLHGRLLRAEADLALTQPSSGWQLQVKRLLLGAASGSLNVSGSVAARSGFNLSGRLLHVDPSRLRPGWPVGDINAVINTQGSLAQPLSATLKFKFQSSHLSHSPLQGALELGWARERLERIVADLNLAGNHLSAHGAYGRAGDRLQASLDAPQLAALGFGFAGRIKGTLDLRGTPQTPQLAVNLQAQQLQLPGQLRARGLSLSGELRGGVSGPFHLQLTADQVAGSGWQVATLRARANGSRAQHSIELDSDQTLGTVPGHLSLRASGGWQSASAAWHGVLQQMSLSGTPALRLLTPLKLELGQQRQIVGPGRLAVSGGEIALQSLMRQANGSIQSRGQVTAIALAQLQPWLHLPVSQSLILDGDWNLSPDGRGRVNLQRRSGDVLLPASGATPPLGLEQARASVNWGAGRTHFDLQANSHFASVSAQGALLALPQNISATTPLAARLQFNAADLSRLSALSGTDMLLAGALSADLTLTGALQHPSAHGPVLGHNLLWQDRKTGVRLSGGELVAHLEGRRLILERLHFAASGGEILAFGGVDFSQPQPRAAIQVEIKHFSVFDRSDRRLVVSGNGLLSVTDRLISLTGKVSADQGRLSLPKEGTPALSDDVVIIGRQAPEASAFAHLPLSVALTLDLGEHFVLTGQGLKVRLSGQVEVKAHPGSAPSARGQVTIVKGSYKAYGQELDIESGSITFVGPLDNPNLNVRARRHLSTVGAGVEVLGSLSEPKLQLISTDSLSERDKLSWLVLGHAASDNAQDSNMLAIAASTLAAGRVNQQMGLFDDLGVARRESRTALNGTVSPAEQVLTVGKQLSRTFYLGYEYGLSSSQQAVKLMYQLSSKWSMILHVGTNAAAESRYTLRFD
jgi:translocation and assembly module TamB